MSARNGKQPAAAVSSPDGDDTELAGQTPLVLEVGRYRVFEAPDGLVIARATNTCQRCQECGCGDQAPPLAVPDVRRGQRHVIQWLMANANTGILGQLKGMIASGQ